MSEKTKKNILVLITLFSLFLTGFQGMIPAIPVMDPNFIVTLSGVTMIVLNILTIWKQKLSEDISNAAIKRTLIVAIIATLAGIGDLFNLFHLSATGGQWVRFVFTCITLFLNIASAYFWPSEAAKLARAAVNKNEE